MHRHGDGVHDEFCVRSATSCRVLEITANLTHGAVRSRCGHSAKYRFNAVRKMMHEYAGSLALMALWIAPRARGTFWGTIKGASLAGGGRLVDVLL